MQKLSSAVDKNTHTHCSCRCSWMDKMNVPDNVLQFFLAIKLFASLYEHNSNNNHGKKSLTAYLRAYTPCLMVLIASQNTNDRMDSCELIIL